MTVSTGVIQVPQALKTPVMQELITFTTLYNTGASMNPQRVTRTDIAGSTPAASRSGTIAISSFPSTNPPYVYICIGSIGNIGQTNTPSFRETN